jgi:hypothetical protein
MDMKADKKNLLYSNPLGNVTQSFTSPTVWKLFESLSFLAVTSIKHQTLSQYFSEEQEIIDGVMGRQEGVVK